MNPNPSLPPSLLAAALLVLLSACAHLPKQVTEVCPLHNNQPLQFVDIFDGPPEELATLVPDEDSETSGHWYLGYVYEAARIVTVRCKYANGKTQDVQLPKRVERCDYALNPEKTLSISCH